MIASRFVARFSRHTKQKACGHRHHHRSRRLRVRRSLDRHPNIVEGFIGAVGCQLHVPVRGGKCVTGLVHRSFDGVRHIFDDGGFTVTRALFKRNPFGTPLLVTRK